MFNVFISIKIVEIYIFYFKLNTQFKLINIQNILICLEHIS